MEWLMTSVMVVDVTPHSFVRKVPTLEELAASTVLYAEMGGAGHLIF